MFNKYSIGSREILQTHDLVGHSLSFVKIPESEKVALASNDELVQKWIGALHRKVVHKKDIPYVIAAGKRAFATDDPVASATFCRKPKKDASVVTDLNKACQKEWGKSIKVTYDMDLTLPHSPSIKAFIELPTKDVFTGWGTSQRDARIDAADKAFKVLPDIIAAKKRDEIAKYEEENDEDEDEDDEDDDWGRGGWYVVDSYSWWGGDADAEKDNPEHYIDDEEDAEDE